MPSILYTSTPTISVGTSIYTTNTLTTLVPTGYYSTAGNSYYVINGVVQSIGSCTPLGTLGQVKVSNDYLTICSNTVVLNVFFNSMYPDLDAALLNGATIYNDNTLTSPLVGYGYIVNSSGGQIYEINPSTGLVGNGSAIFC